jgi:aspartate/methionine/tyrosine aminotransferase
MKTFNIPKRIEKLGEPSSLAILRRVLELREQGIPVINFSSRGDTPTHVKDAAIEMLLSRENSTYTDVRGLWPLRESIAQKLYIQNKIQADPETEIIVTLGAGEGISSTLLALLDSGDEVLLEDPCFLGFEAVVKLAGARPVRIELSEDDNFRLSIEALRDRITPKTRLLMLCNPNNPTGRVFEYDELKGIEKLRMSLTF